MGSAEVAAEARRYAERTPGSAALFAAAQRSLPGGDSRSTLYHAPHPLFVDEAAGSRVWDVDGHELVDLTNNHTALVHGNAHPVVLDAVRVPARPGDVLLRPDGPPGGGGGPSDESAARSRAGPLLRLRVRGHPPRRAGRPGVHRPAEDRQGGRGLPREPGRRLRQHPPQPRPGGAPGAAELGARAEGLARSALADTVVFPFNDLDGTAAVLRDVGPELAAVLVEPVMGSAGMIPAEPGYLAGVRELAGEVGALFVVDEVITLRLALGGGQAWAGAEADLSCFGKMLGGGFPLGAFGGRVDVMDAFDPTVEGGPAARPSREHERLGRRPRRRGRDARPPDRRAHRRVRARRRRPPGTPPRRGGRPRRRR